MRGLEFVRLEHTAAQVAGAEGGHGVEGGSLLRRDKSFWPFGQMGGRMWPSTT